MSVIAGSSSYSTSIRSRAASACGQGLGHHHGHPVADEARLVRQDHRVVGRGFGVALPGPGVRDGLDVPVPDDVDHAVQGQGRGGIDLQDARMGVGRAQHLGVEHARAGEIVGEDGLAAGQLEGIDLGDVVADDAS